MSIAEGSGSPVREDCRLSVQIEPDLIFDTKKFRETLSCFTTGIAIVTTCSPDGEPVGMTISSLASVSLRPPLILFSIDRRAYSLTTMLQAKGYGINILKRAQEQLSNRFSRSLSKKWDDIEYVSGYAGARLFPDSLAHFECKPYAKYDGGDHVIFVVEVVSFATSISQAKPLVFFQGGYQSLAQD